MTKVLGIHHVTAIATDPQRNLDFYAGVLGLRLVKRTVNFDDPGTYHLYFGDERGTPGTIMTFFPWPGAHRGRPGPGQVAVTSFRIPPSALGFWLDRLLRHGIKYDGPRKRGAGAQAEQVLAFQDPDGLLLELVAAPGRESKSVWAGRPDIPAEHAIPGFHSVTLWVESAEATERVLVETLGFEPAGEDAGARTFAITGGGQGARVALKATGGFPRGVGGAGTVHHVAWRVADDAAQLELRDQVIAAGLNPTTVIDRNYFHSVYFGEPGGILFELATDPPGFTIDEPTARLGEKLMLPPQYEPNRAEIEAILPPIHGVSA
jgi:glyoxalase family protein